MSSRRRALTRVVGIWLVCQVIGVAAAPAASLSIQTVMDAAKCECPLAALGQACPMHHTQQTKRQCVLDKAYNATSFAFMSLLGGTGVIPAGQATDLQAVATDSAPSIARTIIFRSHRPESPPPRS